MSPHRMLLPALSAFSLLALSGCATQQITVPLPPNIELVQAGPEVSEYQAAFVGKWEGSWDGRQEARLIVERVLPGDKAEVIYAWGPYGDMPADFHRFEASFDGAALVFHTVVPSTYQFSLRPDAKLDARYEWGGGFSKGLFVRSADKAQ